jgi:hypothetical protein
MRRKQQDDKVPVSIPFEAQGLGFELTQEPQTVKVRSQNRARFYLNANNPITALEGVFTSAGAQRVKRLAITRVVANVCLLNVSANNDTVYWTTTPRPGDTVYDATFVITIPQGFYTPSQLVTAFQAAFNASVSPAYAQCQVTQQGTTGVYQVYTYRTTVATPNPGAFINSYTNTVTPATSNKNGTSTALNKAWGLGLAGANFNDQAPGSTTFYSYTWMQPLAYNARYFDICSRALTMDTKTMNPDLDAPPDAIARVFLESSLPHQIDYTWPEPLNWVNVEDRPLTNIDLRVVLDNNYQGPDDTNLFPNPSALSRVNSYVEVTIEF